MVEENILPVIDKLASAGITLSELGEIKPLINTEDFTETYNLVNSLEAALQPLGRETVKKELQEAAMQYHKQAKIISLKNRSWMAMPLAAASVIIICLMVIFHKTNNYNNPKNYRKELIAFTKQ